MAQEQPRGRVPPARLAGFFYLIIIALGLFDEVFVRERLVVSGDAIATAHNILANIDLYRLGLAAGIVVVMCAIPVTLILYQILRVCGRGLAALAVLFNLVEVATEAMGLLYHYAPLYLLSGPKSLSAFSPEQLQDLAYASLHLQSASYAITLSFFGVFCLLTGILILRAQFLVRLLGLLMMIAGACYLTNSATQFLAPTLQAQLMPYVLIPCFVGELSLALWLFLFGINGTKWREQRAARRAMMRSQAEA